MLWVCVLFAVAIIATLASITGYLFSLGVDSITPAFFTQGFSGDWNNPGGMRAGLTGTIILLAISASVGVPIGMLVGVYLSEYRGEGWLSSPVRFVCDVLSGVPSIVVGILGYELIVVPMRSYSAWAGAFAMAFIMIPIVARTTEEMLRLVPQSYREGSLALGATRAQTIFRVVLPAAAGSVITGIMLAMARVAGETAPLLFTALGSSVLPTSANDLNRPFPSLMLEVFELARGPYPRGHELAWAGLLVLIFILFVLNVAIRALARRSVALRLGSA